jgi:hypothetical protein
MFRTGVTCALGSAVALAILSSSLPAQTTSEQTFYSLSGSNGTAPTDLIQANDGNFYGTTLEGGSNTGTGECVSGTGSTGVDVGCGVIFQQMLPAFVYVLHNFDGADGAEPGPLVEGPMEVSMAQLYLAVSRAMEPFFGSLPWVHLRFYILLPEVPTAQAS